MKKDRKNNQSKIDLEGKLVWKRLRRLKDKQ
jgi:hypothetical protein